MKNKIKNLLAALGSMAVLVTAAYASARTISPNQETTTESNLLKRDFNMIEFSTPNEWSFHKFIEKPVNLYNGSVDVSIPLYEITDGEVSLPISLRYNTSGIRVDEEASWVGLGWNLNLGGYVTCRVVGGYDYSDDTFDNSFRSIFYDEQSGYVHSYGTIPITRTMYDRLGRAQYSDANRNLFGKLQPDVYYFSYPGNAGRYVVDYRDNSIVILQREQDLKIVHEAAGIAGDREFAEKVITTPEGIQHHYADHHVTTQAPSLYPVSISYPLTSTVYPNGSTVTYSYGSYPVTRRGGSASISGSLNYEDDMFNSTFTESSPVSHNPYTLYANETYLQEILTPNYMVVFVSGARRDIISENTSQPARRLDSILIKSRYGQRTLKRFEFTYGYFGDEHSDGETKLRLKLTEVREINPSDMTECINRYQFDYDDTHMFPSKTSYASDYWGYMNSEQEILSTDYLPDLRKLYWNRTDDPDYQRIIGHAFPCYDKSHNAGFCRTGMLESITYPTGGRTEFEYESNSFWGEWIPSVNEHIDTAPVVRYSISDRNSSNDQTYVSIAEDGPREYHVDYKLSRGSNSWQTLSDYSTSITVPFSNSGAPTGTFVNLTDVCLNLRYSGSTDGTYNGHDIINSTHGGTTVFQVNFPNALGDQSGSNGGHGVLSADIWYRDSAPEDMRLDRESYGCGMRVSSISHHDSDGHLLSRTSYSYDDPETGNTSGHLFDRPRYETIYDNAVIPLRPGAFLTHIVHRMYEISGYPVVDNPYGWSSGVGYEYVTETVSGSAGKKEYRFANTAETGGSQRIMIGNPLNGKMLSEKYLDSEGNVVSEVEYNYHTRESSHYYGVILSNNMDRGAELINPADQFWQMQDHAVNGTLYCDRGIEAFTYALNQNDVWLSSVREASDGVEKSTSYTVDTETMLRKSESFVDSDGQTVRTEYRYPSDFSGFNPYRTLAVSRHIISPIVETRLLKNGVLTGSQLTTYDAYGNIQAQYSSSISGTGAASMSAFSSGTPNPSLYPFASKEVTLRDRRGNPIVFRLGGIEDEIILWGYNNRYPVARIKGATRQEVETALGRNLVSLSDLAEPDITSVNALRTSLPGSLVETYTYDMLGNVTSATDASGNIQRYSYDAFGRLITKGRVKGTGLEPVDKYVYTDTSVEHDTYYGASDFFMDICHYNGIGLPEQSMAVGASPSGKTIVQPFHYDETLRESMGYLPYELTTASDARLSNPKGGSKLYWQGVYSSSETAPFTRTVYEDAPTWRPVRQYRPGSTYQNADKHMGTSYGANTAGSVRKLSVNSSGSLVSSGYYGSGVLYRTTTTDEDGRKRDEYTNRMGLKVLEREYLSSSSYADTYYVYDNFCNLAMVVTPEGSSRLSSNGTYSSTSGVVADYCYRNQYDSRRRLTVTYHPGGRYERILYDNMDRPVITSNNTSGWITIQYDACGRTVGQRKFTAPVPDASVIANPTSYSPFGNPVSETVYDSYPTGYTDLAFQAVSGIVSSSDVRGTTTGLKVQESVCDVSEEGQSSPSSVIRRYYYDYLSRPVQIVERTLWGDILRTSFKYDYLGNVTASSETAKGTTKKQVFTYDSRGRMLSEETYINGTKKSTVTNTYDILDRVISSGLGSSVSETCSYSIQGWNTVKTVKKGTTTLFNSVLRYETPYLGSTASYGGNVSSWSMTMNGVSGTKTYVLSYDMMGRLVDAPQYSGSTLSNGFTERNLTYDRNSNVLSLKRYENGSVTDNLSYTYTGNRRSGYTYDALGNVTKKPVDNFNVTYNRLSLPSTVTSQASTGGNYTYLYLSDGTKVSEVNDSGNGYKYIGSMRFSTSSSGDVFESTPFSRGRIVLKSGQTSPSAQYYITDHLGSTRMVLDASGSVLARYEYTPFGVDRTTGTVSSQTDYTFIGKERQPFGSILDFGARLYDPKAAIWNSIDPMATKYYSVTPYAYCINNPVIFVDRDGKLPDFIWDIANVAMDIQSLAANVAVGNIGGAVVDGIGLAADIMSAAVPILPGGAGSIIKTIRGGNNALDAVKTVNQVNDASKVVKGKKTYQTYIKVNEKTGEVYVGRTSGFGTPLDNVRKRDANHHMTDKGFGEAQLMNSTDNYDAIRGQEQYLIDFYGGAKSHGGSSGNSINGVSPKNKNAQYYEDARKKTFDR